MTDFTREIRRRHTSIDRYKGFDLFWRDFDQSFQLQQILDSVVEKKTDLATAREHIRRNYVLSAPRVQDLVQTTEESTTSSAYRRFQIMEVIHAASVASCDISHRNRISMSLAETAAKAGEWERTRQALADAMEGLQIFRRFFIDEEHFITKIEEELKEGWEAEKPHLQRPLDIFEPLSENPAREWIDLILWNSDTNPDNDLVAQSDATIRLGIRFEDWLNRKDRPLKPVILEMSEICKASGGTDPIEPVRCLVTIADSLMEVRQWELAVEIHHQLRAKIPRQNLLAFHAIVQSASCHLKTGDLSLCGKTLHGVDLRLLERTAEFDKIAAAELARFYAVHCHYQERSGRPFPPDAPQRIQDLLKKASALVNWMQGSENRVAHLKNLCYSILVRDIISNSIRRLY